MTVGNMDVGKAHQRKIREEMSVTDNGGLFGNPIADIKTAELREIPYKQAETIILDYEWLGTMGTTQHHYGIFFDGVLGGAVCFGYFQGMQGYASYIGDRYADNGIQLSRGACAHWAHEHSASKLIAYGLREMSKKGYKFVVAFSDPDAGEVGTVYQATNWHYVGFRDNKHWDLYHKDGRVYMNDRDIYKKHGFRGKGKMEEFIKDKPWLEIRLSKPKARYIQLIGTNRENKEMMETLQQHVLPYPKRGIK